MRYTCKTFVYPIHTDVQWTEMSQEKYKRKTVPGFVIIMSTSTPALRKTKQVISPRSKIYGYKVLTLYLCLTANL